MDLQIQKRDQKKVKEDQAGAKNPERMKRGMRGGMMLAVVGRQSPLGARECLASEKRRIAPSMADTWAMLCLQPRNRKDWGLYGEVSRGEWCLVDRKQSYNGAPVIWHFADYHAQGLVAILYVPGVVAAAVASGLASELIMCRV